MSLEAVILNEIKKIQLASDTGIFVPTYLSVGSRMTVQPGTTGTITITPPSGERVKLCLLYCYYDITTTIQLGTRVLIDSQALTRLSNSGEFSIAAGGDGDGDSIHPPICGGIDEVITITCVALRTTYDTVKYVYEFGI